MLHPSGSVQYSSLRISYRSSESSKWKMTIERQQLEQTQRVSNHCYLPFYKKKKGRDKRSSHVPRYATALDKMLDLAALAADCIYKRRVYSTK